MYRLTQLLQKQRFVDTMEMFFMMKLFGRQMSSVTLRDHLRENRISVTDMFLVWSASLGQTLVMQMEKRHPEDGDAQICSLGEPDHILQAR